MQKRLAALPSTVIFAFTGFLLIGLMSGLFGVAWARVQLDFLQPNEAAWIVLLVNTLGYLLASFSSGSLAFRLGMGQMLAFGAGLCAVGMLGYALAPAWFIFIALAFVAGFGNGLVDAGLNAYISAHHSARVMNWLHAFFGIGTTIAPLIMTWAITSASWRVGYVFVALVAVIIFFIYMSTLSLWKLPIRQAQNQVTVRRRTYGETLRMPTVWLSVLVFAFYTGAEGTPGQWTFNLLTGRGVVEETAGFWVSFYWASFTIGRILFGSVQIRLSTTTIVRGGFLLTAVGALILWLNPFNLGVVGLAVMGFAQAPLFPLLISKTPDYVGTEHAANTIGFQIAGAGSGFALLPGLAGILAGRSSIEIVPPFLLTSLIIAIVLHEVLVARTIRKPYMAEVGAD